MSANTAPSPHGYMLPALDRRPSGPNAPKAAQSSIPTCASSRSCSVARDSQAAKLVREHCANLGMPYTETSLAQSYAIVVRYLNRVGLSARDPFDCPMFHQLRGV